MGMDKRTKIGVGGVAAALLASAALMGATIYVKEDPGYLKNTTYLGEDISGKTPDEVLTMVAGKARSTLITLSERGETSLLGVPEDFGYYFRSEKTLSNLQAALEEQKNNTAGVIASLFGGSGELECELSWAFVKDTFKKEVRSQNLGIKRYPSEDAIVSYDADKKEVVVKDEVYGNQFKVADLRSWVKTQLDQELLSKEPQESLTLEVPEDIYRKPEVLASDESLKKQAELLNKYVGAKVVYQIGDDEDVLDYDRIMELLLIDGEEVTISEEKVTEFVKKLAEKYDTRFVDRQFTCHDGEVITIDADINQYGYEIEQEDEVAQLISDIESRTEVTRTPIYDTTNAYGTACWYGTRVGNDDLNGNYVEVCLSDQQVFVYKNGSLQLTSDCVTGNTSLKRGTHTGAYPLGFKRSPAVLRGGTGSGAYASKVTYWMPFHNGEGLHDATWRGSFGGSIYKYHGSHGCVNLPKSKAKEIYNLIEVGYAVIVHW